MQSESLAQGLTHEARSSIAVDPLAQAFVAFAVETGVVQFGRFTTKAGRQSPYFFNAGLFNTGRGLGRLAGFYADRLFASGLDCDMIFGPAYKGIALAAALAVECAQRGRDLPFAYNRKEAKDHGEGGTIVGAPLAGRVLIIDDVMTAGTSVRESVSLILESGARLAGVIVALDRQEKGTNSQSAAQEIRRAYGTPVSAIASLDDVLSTLKSRPELLAYGPAIEAYRRQYGAT